MAVPLSKNNFSLNLFSLKKSFDGYYARGGEGVRALMPLLLSFFLVASLRDEYTGQ